MGDMQLSSIERWRSSERIAEEVLRKLGYEVIEHHKRIVVEGLEIGEVDFIVRSKDGVLYAVEVKAGKVDITGLRQAYVNAILLNMKPLVICKGFADDSAKELAKVLGIEVIQLSDILITEDEELETIVREAVEDALSEYIEMLMFTPINLKDQYIRVLEAISKSSSPNEAAEILRMDVHELLKIVNEMRSQGIIPKWAKRWASLRRVARLIHAKMLTQRTIETLISLSDKLSEATSRIQKLTTLLSKYSNILEKILNRIDQDRNLESERGITSPIQPVVNSSLDDRERSTSN